MIGNTFTSVFSGDGDSTTTSSEKYTSPTTEASYVRVTVNDSTE